MNVFDGFSTYNNFINWYPKLRPDGKYDKVPCVILPEPDERGRPHREIDQMDRNLHAGVSTAVQNAEYGKQKYGIDYGVGLCLTPDDPYIFIDYDNCYDPATGWNNFVTDAVQRFPGAFTEISHSGTGFHVIGSGTIEPDLKTRVRGFPGEIYSHSRFVALTGTHAAGNPLVDITAAVVPYMEHFGFTKRDIAGDGNNAVEYVDQAVPEYTFQGDDEQLLHAMQRSRGSASTIIGDKCHVWDLFTGNADKIARSYPATAVRADGLPYDASEADQALFAHLAYWTGKNTERMRRLFKRSKLYRPEKHDLHCERHIRMSVNRANTGCNAVYNIPAKTGKSVNPVELGDTFLSIEEQKVWFAGCTYLFDLQAVVNTDGTVLDQAQFNVMYGGKYFQMDYENRSPTKKAWEAFTENRGYSFPKCLKSTWNPNEPSLCVNNEGVFNLWVPPVIKTTPGDATPFIQHVYKILPNGDDAKIVLTWMQCVARNPGKKIPWAPVIQGGEGNGKTLLSDVLKHAVGYEYYHLLRPTQIGKEQNGWLSRKFLVVCEEIHTEGRRELLDTLKPLVSNEDTEIRDMGITGITQRNFANFIFYTNFKDAIPVTLDSRRYAIFYTAQQSVEDLKRDGMTEEYFIWIRDWIKNGGQEIINDFLINHPIVASEYIKYRAPQTTSTQEAIEESLTAFQEAVLEAVNLQTVIPMNGSNVIINGATGFKNGWIDTAYLKNTELFDLHSLPRSPKAINQRLKELGYSKICRSSRRTYNGIQRTLYYKGDRNFKNLPDTEITELYINDQK